MWPLSGTTTCFPRVVKPAFHIVLTRPGGKMPAIGGSIQYVNQKFLPLRPDAAYLLFLSRVPATGAYQPASIALKGQVFSSLQPDLASSQWRIYRTAYVTNHLRS
jgi:hypothetical protein